MNIWSKPPAAYDFYETLSRSTQWWGATAKTFWGNPMFAFAPTSLPKLMAAWGEVVERAYGRVQLEPDWGLDTTIINNREYVVDIKTIMDKPFGRLIHFDVKKSKPQGCKVLIAAPMSGHYATLVRKTVKSLLPHSNIYVTEWKNARNVPVSEGKFDVEDYTSYLMDFIRELGPDTHIISICQPVPLTLAAVALLAEENPETQPKTMTLIGGPVDPAAAPTDVTVFGNNASLKDLETHAIFSVGSNYAGVGRYVYPGALQLQAFMAMKWQNHMDAHKKQITNVAQGNAGELDRHNVFYDEYLAVMDMTAEFYLSTVERVFKNREIAAGTFSVNGKVADCSKITRTAVKIVEGGKDDISAPGQCLAALDLLTGLTGAQKAHHLEPGAGHYGIFSGSAWRENIRPIVLEFIDSHA